MFLGDWTAGKILCAKLIPDGAGYRSEISTFMEGTPLNVTDLAVGPIDGSVYVSLGGRDSSGGIYRVRWAGKEDRRLTTYQSLWEEVIRTPMFYSAPTRQRLAELRVKAGNQWDNAIKSIAVSEKNVDEYRIRAINVMQWFGPVPTPEMLTKFSKDKSASIRRIAASIIGSRNGQEFSSVLNEMLADSDPVVRRVAAESLTRRGDVVSFDKVLPLLEDKDERVRLAGRRLLETLPAENFANKVLQQSDHHAFVQGSIALLNIQPTLKNAYDVLVGVNGKLDSSDEPDRLVDLLRVTQLAIAQGKVDGDKIPAFNTKLASRYPHKNRKVNRELTNLLIRLKAKNLSEKFLTFFNDKERSEMEKFHLAYHLPYMDERLSVPCRTQCLDILEAASIKEAGGGSFPFYASSSATKLAKKLVSTQRNLILENADRWPNAAFVVVSQLTNKLESDRIDQLVSIDQKMGARSDSASKKLKLAIVAKLAPNLFQSPNAASWLAKVWTNDPNRREIVALAIADSLNKKVVESNGLKIQSASGKGGTSVATIMASTNRSAVNSNRTIERKRQLQKEFWNSLVKSIPILTQNSAKDVLVTLNDCPQKSNNPEEIRQLILLGLRVPRVSSEVCNLLGNWIGTSGPGGGKSKSISHWQRWFNGRYPSELSASLPSATDSGKWKLNNLWDQLQKAERDATRGREVYKKALCADCHQAGSIGVTVGPDLTTLSKRFTEKETLEAILHPSQVIPQRYRSQVVMTEDGKIHTGLVSESGPTAITIIDSQGKRKTIQKIDIEQTKPAKISVMPNRLLDKLNAQEVADLLEFLNRPSDAKK